MNDIEKKQGKKRLGIPRKDSYTQEEMDNEIDRLRSQFQSQMAEMERLHKQELHSQQQTFEDSKGGYAEEIQFKQSEIERLVGVITTVAEERDQMADQTPRIECIVQALSDRCDQLSGELRKAKGEIARLVIEQSKLLGTKPPEG